MDEIARLREALLEIGDLAANYRYHKETTEARSDFEWIAGRARAALADVPLSPQENGALYKAIEQILDEHSAWIARPNKEVTTRIALAAAIAAQKIEQELAAFDRAALAAVPLPTCADGSPRCNDTQCHTDGCRWAAPPPAETKAARDVLAERRRQVEAEGWTPEHDDEHGDGSLALAAACYAEGLTDRARLARWNEDISGGRGETPVWRKRQRLVPLLWPDSWCPSWFKPSPNRRRDLVKAGALILAEIERLDRPAPPTTKTGKQKTKCTCYSVASECVCEPAPEPTP